MSSRIEAGSEVENTEESTSCVGAGSQEDVGDCFCRRRYGTTGGGGRLGRASEKVLASESVNRRRSGGDDVGAEEVDVGSRGSAVGALVVC